MAASFTRVVPCDLDPSVCSGLVARALLRLGWKLEHSSPDRYVAKVGFNLWSFGERVTIGISYNQIGIISECVMPTQSLDWGKNKQNVEHFLATVQAIRLEAGSDLTEKSDATCTEEPTEKAPRAEDGFVYHIACLLFGIAGVDGAVSSTERAQIWNICQELNGDLRGEPVLQLSSVFVAAESKGGCTAEIYGTLSALARKNETARRFLLGYAWRIAVCDGLVTSEIESIFRLAEMFGASSNEFAAVSAPYWRQNRNNGKRQAAAESLGIRVDSSCEEATAAFRRHAQAYHPDKCASAPPEIRQLAAEKFTQMKRAYDDFLALSAPPVYYGLTEAATRQDNAETMLSTVLSGETVVCFFCRQRNVLPDKCHFQDARCKMCQSLLLFEPELAEVLYGNE